MHRLHRIVDSLAEVAAEGLGGGLSAVHRPPGEVNPGKISNWYTRSTAGGEVHTWWWSCRLRGIDWSRMDLMVLERTKSPRRRAVGCSSCEGRVNDVEGGKRPRYIGYSPVAIEVRA